MNLLTLLPFLSCFILANLLLMGILFKGPWTASLLFFAFVIHPLLDQLLGKSPPPTSVSSTSISSMPVIGHTLYSVLLWFYIPFQFFLMGYTLYEVSLSHFTALETVALCLSLGTLTGGIGITVAHELIHRRNRFERFLGVVLLTSVQYAHFRVEHVYGHHVHIATPRDPATARLGESLYSFWLRSLKGGLLSAFRIESERLEKRPTVTRLFSNRIYHYMILQFIVLLFIHGLFGVKTLGFYIAHSLVAILLLESINYIEHYGLSRKVLPNGRYEPVSIGHSWDSAHRFTNWFLFNLGKHSHHHAAPLTPYERLQNHPQAPQLEFGYSTLILMAMIPPLWKTKNSQMLATFKNKTLHTSDVLG